MVRSRILGLFPPHSPLTSSPSVWALKDLYDSVFVINLEKVPSVIISEEEMQECFWMASSKTRFSWRKCFRVVWNYMFVPEMFISWLFCSSPRTVLALVGTTPSSKHWGTTLSPGTNSQTDQLHSQKVSEG